jgi:thiol-disulfide isomerase/thioredoxin
MLALRACALTLALSAVASAGETILLDFTARWCGPCQATAPAIDRLVAAGYPVRKVDLDTNRALATQYGVSSVPTFLMLVDGKPVDRLVGGTSYERLVQMFDKAGVRPGNKAAHPSSSPSVRGQSPESPAVQDPGRGLARPAIPARQPIAPAVANGAVANGTAAAGEPKPLPSGAVDAQIVKRVLDASVRIRVKEAVGFSNGSGTIIDTHQDEALVLTCGHIFRDSQGKGEITIDVFGANPASKVPAVLVGYDDQRDVGLVSFRPGVPVTVSRVAGPDCTMKPGEPVVSVGCDGGAPPNPRQSRVNSVNKFLGPANITADGEPAQGRSGGGLFNARGEVIGVCNAANPSDREGLYAALATIHAQLDAAKLSFVYKPSANPGLGSTQASSTSSLAAASPPALSATMPLFPPPPNSAAAGDANLARVLGMVANPPAGAEVICVVRSLTDPRAKSDVIVLDRVSPAFLAQLDRERGNQLARRQTGLRSLDMPVASQQPPPPGAATSADGWMPAWRAPETSGGTLPVMGGTP